MIYPDTGDAAVPWGKMSWIRYSLPLCLLPFFGCLSLDCSHATGYMCKARGRLCKNKNMRRPELRTAKKMGGPGAGILGLSNEGSFLSEAEGCPDPVTPAVQPYEQDPEGPSEIQRKPRGTQEGGGGPTNLHGAGPQPPKMHSRPFSSCWGTKKNGVPLPAPNLKVSQSSG